MKNICLHMVNWPIHTEQELNIWTASEPRPHSLSVKRALLVYWNICRIVSKIIRILCQACSVKWIPFYEKHLFIHNFIWLTDQSIMQFVA